MASRDSDGLRALALHHEGAVRPLVRSYADTPTVAPLARLKQLSSDMWYHLVGFIVGTDLVREATFYCRWARLARMAYTHWSRARLEAFHLYDITWQFLRDEEETERLAALIPHQLQDEETSESDSWSS